MISKSTSSKTTTFLQNNNIFTLKSDMIAQVIEAAEKDPLKRARLCLHKNHADKVQEMIVALIKGTYVRPHRHTKNSESFHVISGTLLLVFFDDLGHVIYTLEMAAEQPNIPFIYRLSSDLWHTVIPLSKCAVYHETSAGPFTKKSSEFAPWSPEENESTDIRLFLTYIEGLRNGKSIHSKANKYSISKIHTIGDEL